MRGVIAWAVGWLLALGLAATALAHEVRPALVQIIETGAGGYEVTWKQPVVGDMAVRLAPRLSGGSLDRPPDRQTLTPSYLIKSWRVSKGAALEGQTLRIDGLAQSVTDVLVRVRTADGREVNRVLRPADPGLRLALEASHGLAVPAYLRLGVEHILTGPDHLAFVLGLLLLIGFGWRVVKSITAFTVAHSLTLAIAALGYVRFPSAAIEALVALSILFVACELARGPGADTLTRRRPWLIAFAFGLLHGLAFAGALTQVGLPAKGTPMALLLFNVGVEIGQLAFIAVAVGVMMLARPFAVRAPALARAAPAYAIGGVSSYWLLERVAAAVG